jgi:acyl carrier protein
MEREKLAELIRVFIWRSFVPNEQPESLTEELDLIDSGVLDSLAMVEVADFLEGLSGTPIETHELTRRNIGSIGAMVRFVSSRQPAASV